MHKEKSGEGSGTEVASSERPQSSGLQQTWRTACCWLRRQAALLNSAQPSAKASSAV